MSQLQWFKGFFYITTGKITTPQVNFQQRSSSEVNAEVQSKDGERRNAGKNEHAGASEEDVTMTNDVHRNTNYDRVVRSMSHVTLPWFRLHDSCFKTLGDLCNPLKNSHG